MAEARGGDIHVVPANGDSHSGSPQHFLYLQDKDVRKQESGDDKEKTAPRKTRMEQNCLLKQDQLVVWADEDSYNGNSPYSDGFPIYHCD